MSLKNRLDRLERESGLVCPNCGFRLKTRGQDADLDLTKLSDEELRQLANIVRKARPDLGKPMDSSC